MASDYRYRCYNCEREFDEPQTVKESRGEFWGVPCWEEMHYCPYCGSEEFDYTEEDPDDDEDDDYYEEE